MTSGAKPAKSARRFSADLFDTDQIVTDAGSRRACANENALHAVMSSIKIMDGRRPTSAEEISNIRSLFRLGSPEVEMGTRGFGCRGKQL